MAAISQKDYLKKYLNLGRDEKKKKKKDKKKLYGDRLKIIDDNIDVSIAQEIQDDIAAENEDAPQIVAVIDERPLSMRVDDNKNPLWQPIGEVASTSSVNHGIKVNNFTLNKKTKDRILDLKLYKNKDFNTNKKNNSTGSSPITKTQRTEDASPPRKRKNSVDVSPPRKRRNSDECSHSGYKNKNSSDISLIPKRRDSCDISPVRNRKNSIDMSPPRKRNNRFEEHDLELPKKHEKEETSHHDSKNKRKDSLKKKSRWGDQIICADQIKRERSVSPTRSSKRDTSPRRHDNTYRDTDYSPSRKKKVGSTGESREKSSKYKLDKEDKNIQKKADRTMSGKKAGLQTAKNLVEEIQTMQQKEDEIFKSMSAEVLGVNAATVVRSKKREEDPEEVARKLQKEKELKEKYDRWGKGLKQMQDETERMADSLHEMSKPLARYADDEDLERYLKEQEREGDPMLAYIRKKKRKKKIEAGIPEKPMYMGEFMPNRFGIRPGYRWDGVDRSNGYEKKWFEIQNKKKALQDEAHKWSTEDM